MGECRNPSEKKKKLSIHFVVKICDTPLANSSYLLKKIALKLCILFSVKILFLVCSPQFLNAFKHMDFSSSLCFNFF